MAFLFEKLLAVGAPDPGFANDGVAQVRAGTWSYADSMTGIGSPGEQFIHEPIEH